MPGHVSRVGLDAQCCDADGGMCRRGQHLIGDPIGFLLVDIPWFIDPQLGLQGLTELFLALALCTSSLAHHLRPAGALAL
jgi:hypothetical protein